MQNFCLALMFEGYLAMFAKDIRKLAAERLDSTAPCDHQWLATIIESIMEDNKCTDIRAGIIAACEVIREGHAEIIEAKHDEQVFGGPIEVPGPYKIKDGLRFPPD